MNVFAKIFAQIFDSSIAGDYVVRHVFMDLLVLADRDGVVDMTLDAISRRTNVPEELVAHAITELLKPDRKSRSHAEEGCRILPLDSHRDWGWQIVNYEHYRNIRDEEARRTYFRDKKREQRVRDSKESPTMSKTVKTCQTISTQGEEEGDREIEIEKKGTPSPDSDSELMLAGWIFEEACIPADNATRRVVADCIRLLVKQDGGTTKSAAEFILAAVKQGIADGDTISRFWFSDRKYLPKKTKRPTCGPNGLPYQTQPDLKYSDSELEEIAKHSKAVHDYVRWMEKARRDKALRESEWMEPPDNYGGRVLNRDGKFTEQEISQ